MRLPLILLLSSILLVSSDFLYSNNSHTALLSDQSYPCGVPVEPDLPLIPSDSEIEASINNIVKRISDKFLGTVAPKPTAIATAVNQYNGLNISVVNGEIFGKELSAFEEVSFLKTFAQQLKFNPDDQNIKEMADRTVWLVSKQMCKGTLSDFNMYSYRVYVNAGVFLADHLSSISKELFTGSLMMQTGMEHFYVPDYGIEYQKYKGAINTDLIYNVGEIILAHVSFMDTPEERYRYMRTFKRFMERFFSYTIGTHDGLKPDGTGYHHWTAYDAYMYAYRTAAYVLNFLDGSPFQVDKSYYLNFRDAVYTQMIYSNDANIKALSMSGRHPQGRTTSLDAITVESLAIAGGDILGLATADTILAAEYNRVWGVNSKFNYFSITPFQKTEGFYQFNYAAAGVFRKNNRVIVAKGFTDKIWGTETYAVSNRYGRYQSYGALEIIYPGNAILGNGFDANTWDWNYNPGATTIVLPWSMLHAQTERIDEFQQKDFAGALAFKNKNKDILKQTSGTIGMFAMDFQQREGLGWGKVYGPKNHNATFTFKKSYFLFDDFILCLGSDINNNDTKHNTVTTLFQRLYNNGRNLWLNGRTQYRTGSLEGDSDNWILSNYLTGFYIVADSNNIIRFEREVQQTPNQDQTNPNLYTGNPKAEYWKAYIDHGTAPENIGYEYIVIPGTTREEMDALETQIKNGNKPYIIHQKNDRAHVVEHHDGTRGYAVFKGGVPIDSTGLIAEVSKPSLIMYEHNSGENRLMITLVNPTLELSSNAFSFLNERPIDVTLRGSWMKKSDNSNVTVQNSDNNTLVTFITKDGLPEEVILYQIDGVSTGMNPADPVNFSVYPNPANSDLFIKTDKSDEISWRIINSCGEILLNGISHFSPTKIDISHLPNGLYILKGCTPKKNCHEAKIVVIK